MRRRILVKSVRALTPEGADIGGAAALWRLSPLGVGVILLSLPATFVLLSLLGVGRWPERLVISGLATVMLTSIAIEATVVAMVDGRPVLFRGSRVRQRAVSRIGPIDGAGIEKVSSTMISSEWRIGRDVLQAGKRAEKDLEAMFGRSAGAGWPKPGDG